MAISEIYSNQLKLAKAEFGHVVEAGEIVHTPGGFLQKLRLNIIDGSVVDVFLSSPRVPTSPSTYPRMTRKSALGPARGSDFGCKEVRT